MTDRFPLRSIAAFAGAALVCVAGSRPAVAADPATLAELQASSAVKLTRDDLQALIPGGRNESRSRNGGTNTRQFTHDPDGRLMARLYGPNQRPGGTGGEGTWSISDDGRYCVDMRWTGNTGSADEKWCASVWKAGDEYFAVFGDRPDTRPWKQGFRK